MIHDAMKKTILSLGLEALHQQALLEKIAEIATILKPDLKDAMKIQMTPWKEADKVKIEDLYTRLRIETHTKKPQRTQKEELVDYGELFNGLGKNRRILIKGNPGIGKTTFSRKVAFDWANDSWPECEQLESILVTFLVTLKYIDSNQSIADMIKQQHPCLVLNKKVTTGLLSEILEECGHHCLVILEGYDEIPEDFNMNLDYILENKAYRDCHFIVTSRPNAVENLEHYMGAIASIEGFSKENTRRYIEKVIEDHTKWRAAYQYTEDNAIEDMWRYPILVLFLCLLVNWGAVDLNTEKLMVGEFYTRLLHCIFRRFIAEKIGKEKQEEEEAKREEMLLKIGKVAYNGLLSGKVTYKKKDILKEVGPYAFQYGILIGTDEWEGRRDMPENADIFVYFVHKSIQEYLAAKYFIHRLVSGHSIESLISEEEANLDFVQQNLMFFTFCGFFASQRQSDKHHSDLARLHITRSLSVKEQLVDFLVKCLDGRKLKLEGVAIYEESAWLFLEVLPKCSQIEDLVLKEMNLKVSLPFLLGGISESLHFLHIDSCVFHGNEHIKKTSITFPRLNMIKFSGELAALSILLSSAWKAVTIVDLEECDFNEKDIKVIDRLMGEVNAKGYLPCLKTLLINRMTLEYEGYIEDLLATLPKYTYIHELHLKQTQIRSIDLLENISLGSLHIEDCKLHHSEDREKGGIAVENVENCTLVCAEEKEIYKIFRTMLKSIYFRGRQCPLNSFMLSHVGETLETLDFTQYLLSKKDLVTIVQANMCGNLPSLKNLFLNGKTMVSGHVHEILNSSFPLLETLDFDECNLTRKDMLAIVEAFNKGLLPRIDLTGVFLAKISHRIPVVPVMCGAWRNEEVLHLREMEFSNQCAVTLAEANRHGLLPSVKEIKMYWNKKVGGQLGTILSGGKWQLLQILDLRHCNLHLSDITALAEVNSRGYLPQLKVLELMNSPNVAGAGLKALLFHTWPALYMLSLWNCSLTSNDAFTLHLACKKGRLPQLRNLQINDGIFPYKMIEELKGSIEMIGKVYSLTSMERRIMLRE